jgi:HPt (histidine-containing phosphotransfer) domain-containing protein
MNPRRNSRYLQHEVDPVADDLDESALERLQRIGGSALTGKMIDLFLVHATATIEAAARAKQEGNAKGVVSAMHSLKSSAGNVGARTVQHLAESLEHDAPVHDAEWVANGLADLKLAYERAASLLLQRKAGLDR